MKGWLPRAPDLHPFRFGGSRAPTVNLAGYTLDELRLALLLRRLPRWRAGELAAHEAHMFGIRVRGHRFPEIVGRLTPEERAELGVDS